MTSLFAVAVRWALSWAEYWARACREPRVYLLEWAHRCPVGGGVFAAVGAATVLGIGLPPRWVVVTAAVLAAPSVLLALAGEAAHAAWNRGWVLRGTVCPCCGPDDDGPEDGQDPDADDPDGPDGCGLTPADELWLHSIGAALTAPERTR